MRLRRRQRLRARRVRDAARARCRSTRTLAARAAGGATRRSRDDPRPHRASTRWRCSFRSCSTWCRGVRIVPRADGQPDRDEVDALAARAGRGAGAAATCCWWRPATSATTIRRARANAPGRARASSDVRALRRRGAHGPRWRRSRARLRRRAHGGGDEGGARRCGADAAARAALRGQRRRRRSATRAAWWATSRPRSWRTRGVSAPTPSRPTAQARAAGAGARGASRRTCAGRPRRAAERRRRAAAAARRVRDA